MARAVGCVAVCSTVPAWVTGKQGGTILARVWLALHGLRGAARYYLRQTHWLMLTPHSARLQRRSESVRVDWLEPELSQLCLEFWLLSIP